MMGTSNSHQPAPALASAPPPQALPLGAARGPTWPPTEQLQQPHYCIDSNPSWPEAFLLAFQHYIVMLGTTVLIATTLVPRMGGNHGDKARVIQTILFMAGLNTLLQTILGTRLPTVMGASFAFLLPVLAIINDLGDENFSTGHERFVHTMRTIQGSMIVSSFVNIIIGYTKAWGNLTRLFSPVVLVPVVCVVGLGLFMRGFPVYLKRIIPMGHFLLERFALLFCIGIIWAFAAILTVAGAYNMVPEQTKMSCRTDHSFLIQSAPWIKFPYPFQWGTPIFRASHVFGMIGAALVTSAESTGTFFAAARLSGATPPPAHVLSRSIGLQSTGTFFAAARLSGATPPPAHVLSRSIGLQGVGLLLDGIFGAAAGTTASVENVGLLGLTHIGSRRVVQISTAFMIFFSIFGKFGALFASIPLSIFAAINCVLFGIVAAVGISFIQFANNNSLRNLYVLGLSLFLGISIPQYFVTNTDLNSGDGPVRADGGQWFNNIMNTIFSSQPAVAMIVGMLLDNTIDRKLTIMDRGIPWWVPFQNRNGDVRNDEFYSLPLWMRIKEYIPEDVDKRVHPT